MRRSTDPLSIFRVGAEQRYLKAEPGSETLMRCAR
jgi:hypothetical protein